MSNTQTSTNPQAVGQLADRSANKAQQVLDSTQRMANDAIESASDSVSKLRERAPAAISRAAAQVEELTSRAMERARDVGTDIRDQANRAGDRTVSYIRDEPIKSVLICVAAGAALAVLVRALSNRNT